jgi:hypothetical protein
MPMDLPTFPVKQWLQFLAKVGKNHVLELHDSQVDVFSATAWPRQKTARRAHGVELRGDRHGWHLLCEFTGRVAGRGQLHRGSHRGDEQPHHARP